MSAFGNERRKGWFTRLLCLHRWRPVNDGFYGTHSCFDVITKAPRRWECRDCGKRIVARTEPVSYFDPNDR